MPETTPPAAPAVPNPAAAAPTVPAAPGAPAPAAAASAATTPPAAPAAAPTALTVDSKAAPAPEAPDWRAAYGTDEKLQKLLGRYSSAEAFGKAHLEAVSTIGKGLKQPLKEGASAEEVAAWRKDNGIPETADGYFAQLPGGLVLGQDDKALFTEWAGAMHKLNAPPGLVHETVKWYYAMQEQQTANQEALDRQHQTEATTALKAAWGRDYTENLNVVNAFLGGMTAETRQMFMDATMPDGRRLFNSPEVVQFFTQKARELNPIAFIPGAGGGDEGRTLNERIESIEKVMRENRAAYNKNPKMQEDLRALYARREQLKERGAA